jgi:hypothetical protein
VYLYIKYACIYVSKLVELPSADAISIPGLEVRIYGRINPYMDIFLYVQICEHMAVYMCVYVYIIYNVYIYLHTEL